MDLVMDDQRDLDHFDDYSELDNIESTERRPSILITFQNSASYYTSYMGGNGGRGPGGRRKNSEVLESDVHPNHPIVVMNEYPNPGPVLVAVNGRKHSCDRSYNPFLCPHVSHDSPSPSVPSGPPGPPGPPTPNMPSSRRSSITTTSLELSKRRRASMTPGLASSTRRDSSLDRQQSSSSRVPLASTLPVVRPSLRPGNYESSTLPRGYKMRPPRNSQSMPTLNEIDDGCDFELLNPPEISPRPSLCSSAMTTESHGERRPLVPETPLVNIPDDWNPHQKPDWLSLDLDHDRENDNKRGRTRSVYVAEMWPSLVCILTAVLVTLIIYLVISYIYSQPIPSQTRNRILPAHPKYPRHPSYDNLGYPPPYPYNPGHYEHYPPPYPQNLPPPPDP